MYTSVVLRFLNLISAPWPLLGHVLLGCIRRGLDCRPDQLRYAQRSKVSLVSTMYSTERRDLWPSADEYDRTGSQAMQTDITDVRPGRNDGHLVHLNHTCLGDMSEVLTSPSAYLTYRDTSSISPILTSQSKILRSTITYLTSPKEEGPF